MKHTEKNNKASHKLHGQYWPNEQQQQQQQAAKTTATNDNTKAVHHNRFRLQNIFSLSLNYRFDISMDEPDEHRYEKHTLFHTHNGCNINFPGEAAGSNDDNINDISSNNNKKKIRQSPFSLSISKQDNLFSLCTGIG